MTPEAQRIAIAEACGWELVCPPGGGFFVYWQRGSERCEDLPNYLSDLNAMHEVEKVLTDAKREQYANTLYRLPAFDALKDAYDDVQFDAVFKLMHATAAQRAEAFLRTIGKWDDTK